MTSCPIVTVVLWFDRPVMTDSFVGLPGRTMQWVFDKQAVYGGGASHLSLVSSGAADTLRWTNPQLVERALDDVRAALAAGKSPDEISMTWKVPAGYVGYTAAPARIKENAEKIRDGK